MVAFTPVTYIGTTKYSSTRKFGQISLMPNTTSDNDIVASVLRNGNLFVDVSDNYSLPEVNPHNFRYIVNPYKMCKKNGIQYLIYVHSAPDNHKKRMSIRDTWGSREVLIKYKMRLVFIMGVVNDSLVMDNVLLESDLYGDIIVENFHDAYRNMTLKAVGALRWVSSFCRTPKFVIKTDDDVFVDIHPFMRYMNSDRVQNNSQKIVMCYLWENTKVSRDKKNKWYASKEEHPDDIYSPYCSGSVYILSADLIDVFHGLSYSTPFFWIDDVFVTGLLSQKLGVNFIKLNKHYVLDEKGAHMRFSKDKDHMLKFLHVDQIDDIYYMWGITSERMDEEFQFVEG